MKRSFVRAKLQEQINKKHEPNIKKVVAKRKAIAAKIYALQQEDKELAVEMQTLQKARDEEHQAEKEKMREALK